MLGRNLGNYHVVSQIGEGGMGVVYLARHVTLGRNAAVKVLRPELTANREIAARFFNEARAATAVRHAGIIEVFDFGFLEDRSAYIIMEFLEGESLAARIRRGPLSISTALIVVRAIARALQAAHEHSIVHRDLKPDNVFLVPDADLPGGERIKLLDFGIAKLASVGEASHTRTGAVMGTPTYMAPEQCRGAGSVDHRADLYALGCVAYEMVCGTPPFVAEGVGDLIASHLHFQPEPLRTRRLDVPVEVEALVLCLLQKDPQARPQSAGDVVQSIDRLVAAGVGGVHGAPMGLQGAPRGSAAHGARHHAERHGDEPSLRDPPRPGDESVHRAGWGYDRHDRSRVGVGPRLAGHGRYRPTQPVGCRSGIDCAWCGADAAGVRHPCPATTSRADRARRIADPRIFDRRCSQVDERAGRGIRQAAPGRIREVRPTHRFAGPSSGPANRPLRSGTRAGPCPDLARA